MVDGAKLLNKSDDENRWNEPRLTLNLDHAEESLSRINVTYLHDVHTRLSNQLIEPYSSFDPKHACWSILVHPN